MVQLKNPYLQRCRSINRYNSSCWTINFIIKICIYYLFDCFTLLIHNNQKFVWMCDDDSHSPISVVTDKCATVVENMRRTYRITGNFRGVHFWRKDDVQKFRGLIFEHRRSQKYFAPTKCLVTTPLVERLHLTPQPHPRTSVHHAGVPVLNHYTPHAMVICTVIGCSQNSK